MAFGLLSREEQGGALPDEKSNWESAASSVMRHYGNGAPFFVLSGTWG